MPEEEPPGEDEDPGVGSGVWEDPVGGWVPPGWEEDPGAWDGTPELFPEEPGAPVDTEPEESVGPPEMVVLPVEEVPPGMYAPLDPKV